MGAEEQVRELREGGREAVARLVREHTEALLAGALGLGFGQADAEELVQDVFVAFLGALSRFEGRSTVKTFLFGILYNKASELRRRRAREEASEDIEAIFDARFGFLSGSNGIWCTMPRGPEDEALASELAGQLDDCAGRLSLDQRTAFYLREVERETTESICEALGVTATNLGVLLFRARNKLRECLQKKWETRK